MHAEFQFAIEDTVFAGHVDVRDVQVQLFRKQLGYFGQNTHTVYAPDVDGNREEHSLVGVPSRGQNMISVAGIQLGGNRALSFVDDNVVVLVQITQNVVAGIRVAALGNV